MAYTEFYCNPSTGSNMNGGSDENASPSYSHTNGGWNSGTGVYTPASGDPSASGVSVGQFAHVFVDGSTTPTFVGRVTAVSSTTITVSTTAKSGTAPSTSATARSINVGGCWLGPAGTSWFPLNFMAAAMTDSSSNSLRVNMKNNAVYEMTAGVQLTATGYFTVQGYSSTVGDGGLANINCASGLSSVTDYLITLMSASANFWKWIDIEVSKTGGSQPTSGGFRILSNYVQMIRCVFTGFPGYGLLVGQYCEATECEAYGNTAIGFSANGPCVLTRCIANGNTTAGYANGDNQTINVVFNQCIASNNGANGWNLNRLIAELYGCVAYNNTGAGILNSYGAAGSMYFENCILHNNSTYGVNLSGSTRQGCMVNCAFYNNTSGPTNALSHVEEVGSITLSASPFVDAANGDFRLNNTANAGALLRGTGRGYFLQTESGQAGTVAYPDVGAAQHQETAGGSALFIPVVNTILG